MRLLVLTADYPPAQWSGIAAAVAHHVAALAAIGCDVRVLVAGGDGASAPFARNVHLLSRQRFPIAIGQDDVVHLHSLALAELAIELCRRYRLPLLYTAHSLLELELGATARDWIRVQRRIFAAASRVIFVSRLDADAAHARYPWLEGRADVVGNGVPPPPLLRSYSADGPIVFAGRFTRGKGIDIVARVVAALANRRFVLAGGHGDRDGHALAGRLERQFSDRCQVAGWLSPHALHDLFASAALVLVPSRYEPFGMVAIEAMRMGTPVLASTAGGLGELSTLDSGARHVSTFDAHAWIDACETLLDDGEAREQMHRRGPVYVAERCSARATARRIFEIATSVTSGMYGPFLQRPFRRNGR